MNIEQARQNMIEQQIRSWDVLDQKVLDLLASVPREKFVPAAYRNMAFMDTNLPLPHQQEMMAPKIEARILQALQIQPDESVLEVGTGSGYMTALMARQAQHVYSVDIYADFTEAARQKLAEVKIPNVTLETGNAACGWDQHGPYDVILVTGSMPILPDEFKASLKTGGRMIVIIGDSPAMEVKLIKRINETDWAEESLFETDLLPLAQAKQPERFKL